ncbi:phosphoserine phosphatase-like isoform X2 [Biomphalaria glabrata]|uniref:Phosphoserine phosphatase n=1 Tax=Biomphalaria glabrata TaxID=6526 RepID=A0A9W3A484_BIOGL|nr:phosphoserine phosphatase-like isoform X2 [Biomphalaria glabrata]XP_055882092.1 phosphoserine phosphatase-like isoform X2 [Biomphalaria glabrata]XP_055882093.1 phosphoserine phosphatase-like isoform X2 [Biomphalaria glabrata]
MPLEPIFESGLWNMLRCSVMTTSKEYLQKLWREADAVCFDVDSTVIKDEGLDDLANYCGVGPQVEAMTLKAMGGGMTFREALTQRLNIVKPTRQTVENFIVDHPSTFSPNIKELIALLKSLNKQVYLVTGGFRSIITPVANDLNIPQEHLFANTLLFNEDGSYAGFDTSSLTSESGGKARVVQHIKDTYKVKTVVFVGDGATDMEACPPSDGFIGYGGNVVRAAVKKNAAWFVTDFQELIDQLTKTTNEIHKS